MGKTLKLTLVRAAAPQAPLFGVRGYGDPVMVSLMGLDTTLQGTGNFQVVCLYDPHNSGFGAVTNYQRMDAQALDYLESLQPTGDGYTLKQKMGWLGRYATEADARGRPYMWNNGYIVWGLMVFGYNQIQVERAADGTPVSYPFLARYQNRPSAEVIEMYRVKMFRRSDMGRPLAELLSAGLVHHATEAFYPTNALGVAPRGVIYNPVWSPQDWPTNTGYANDLYIPRSFLK